MSSSKTQNFLRRLNWPQSSERHWKLIPTLLRNEPKAFLGLIAIGSIISGITIATLDLALLHEMSGILSSRPLDVYVFIVGISFLVGGAVLFYPFLLLNHRMQVYVEEETERLSAKYREGLQQYQIAKSKIQIPEKDQPVREDILKKMSEENPDFQDFAYLYSAALEIENQSSQEIDYLINSGKQTYEQIKKDILRELIYSTAWENLEDSAYDLSAYIMPVTYCMASIALGLITFSLIPLLGTSTIMIGETSLNLTWAVGGFIGAYLYSFLPFFQRCTRRDLPPRAFLHYGLNIFIGTVGVALFGNLFLGSIAGSATQLAAAAVLGSVPFYLLAAARKQGLGPLKLGASKPSAGCQDLCEIPGIDYEYAERLREEGIMNIQNLAFADIENLSKRTRLNRAMLFDWKDQAILMLLTRSIQTNNMKNSGGS